MPFGVVSGVGRGMVIRLGWRSSKGKGSFGGKCGVSRYNQRGLCGLIILCRGVATRCFPNYFGISCYFCSDKLLINNFLFMLTVKQKLKNEICVQLMLIYIFVTVVFLCLLKFRCKFVFRIFLCIFKLNVIKS